MFETEAGFAETRMLVNCNGDYAKKQDYKKGWQDGAEFGYNKAKEEMQENGLALQSDMDRTIEQNLKLKAQVEELEKENEKINREIRTISVMYNPMTTDIFLGNITPDENFIRAAHRMAEEILKNKELIKVTDTESGYRYDLSIIEAR